MSHLNRNLVALIIALGIMAFSTTFASAANPGKGATVVKETFESNWGLTGICSYDYGYYVFESQTLSKEGQVMIYHFRGNGAYGSDSWCYPFNSSYGEWQDNLLVKRYPSGEVKMDREVYSEKFLLEGVMHELDLVFNARVDTNGNIRIVVDHVWYDGRMIK